MKPSPYAAVLAFFLALCVAACGSSAPLPELPPAPEEPPPSASTASEEVTTAEPPPALMLQVPEGGELPPSSVPNPYAGPQPPAASQCEAMFYDASLGEDGWPESLEMIEKVLAAGCRDYCSAAQAATWAGQHKKACTYLAKCRAQSQEDSTTATTDDPAERLHIQKEVKIRSQCK